MDQAGLTLERIDAGNAPDPHAPETIRRRRLLGFCDDQNPSLLADANGEIAAMVTAAFDAATGQRRTLAGEPYADQTRHADLFANNATAGLGKSTHFLAELARRTADNPELTAVVISETHELSQQSYQTFCKIVTDDGRDASTFARFYIAVDEGCKRTCEEHKTPKPMKQRKVMSASGVEAKKFCNPREQEDELGRPIHPGCPLRQACTYWKQLAGWQKIKVWFISHAAAKTGSLAASGITTPFDIRFIDENCVGLFTETETLELDLLPDFEGHSSLAGPIKDRSGFDLAKEVDTFEIAEAVRTFVSYGIIDMMEPETIGFMRTALTKMLTKHLRPGEDSFGFDPNAEEPKDHSPIYARHGIKGFKTMRLEAYHARLACDFLLSLTDEYPSYGYTINRIPDDSGHERLSITIVRRAGFRDRCECNGQSFTADEYEHAWQAYHQALYSWTGEGAEPERPRYQFLGSPVFHADATLTPAVVEACFKSRPDHTKGTAFNLLYTLAPHRRDLVKTIQVKGFKAARNKFGITTKRPKTETGRYRDPEEHDKPENLHKVAARMRAIETIIDYHESHGEQVLTIAPKQIVPDNTASNQSFVTLSERQYIAVDGKELPAQLSHGSVAGKNGYHQAGAILIISQGFSENPRDHENIATALTGQPVSQTLEKYQSCDLEAYAQNSTTGNYVPSSRPTHPDPLTEAVRWQMMEGPIIQAIARTRAVRRGRSVTGEAANIENDIPLTVYIINRLILDDEDITWKQLRDLVPSQHDYLHAMGLHLPDTSKFGAREFANALTPQATHVSARSWTNAPYPEAPEGWKPAIALHKPSDDARMRKVPVMVKPGCEAALRAAGVVFDATLDDELANVLRQFAGPKDKWVSLKEIGIRMLRSGADKPVSGQKLRQMLEGVAEVKKRKTGLSVLIKADTSQNDT